MPSIRRTLVFASPFLLAAASAVSCTSEPERTPESVQQYGVTFEEWKATVYQEQETGVWIVNGDTPIVHERALREFFMNHVQPGALVVHQAGGVDARGATARSWPSPTA